MQKKINKTIFITAFVAIVMFGFSFALAPLYSALCKTIGINTAIRTNPVDLSREITVELVAMNNQNLFWDFYPQHKQVRVHPEENIKIIFFAKNKTNQAMTVQAIPSYAPADAVKYFHKTQCFCFNKQTLKAGEMMSMPVVFRIDKELPQTINTITLAYTLFDLTSQLRKTP